MKLSPVCTAGMVVASAGMWSSVHAAHFTTTAVQASGADWNAAIWNPGPVSPTAGNTYEVLLGGRVRSPAGTTGSPLTYTFPGDFLQLDGSGFSSTTGTAGQSAELRFKSNDNANIYNFPGVNGNAGLVLNGGILNDGDDRIITIAGQISATAGTTSSFNPGGGATTDISAARGFLLTAGIVGSGSLSLDYGHDFGGAGVTVPALQINSSNGNFTGNWIVNSGWLKGTGANSLGFGNFTLGSAQGPSTLDFDYDVANPTKALTLIGGNSKLILDQNLTFGSVTINSTALAPGLYTYQQLKTQFDSNIVTGGTGTLTVVPEPMSTALLLVGGLGLAAIRRRR